MSDKKDLVPISPSSGGGFFSNSFFSSVSANVTSLTQTIQKKGIPELSKRFQEIQDRARELPSTLIHLQAKLESERETFIKDKKRDKKNGILHQSKGSEMVAPWLGFTGYGSQLKEAILNISNDERNLLIPPPAGANFEFDLNAYDSTAQAALKEDEKLAKLRFLLVPQQVSESVFWQNYFYRVKITKQMVFGNPPESPLIGGDKDMNDKKNVLFDYEDDTDDKNTKKIIEKKNDRKRDCSIQNKAENDTNPNALEVKRGNHTDKEYEGMEDWEIEMRREAIQ